MECKKIIEQIEHEAVKDTSNQEGVEQGGWQSDSLFRLLAESAPVGIVISDKSEKTIYVNRHFTELSGYTVEDVPSVKQWWPLAYPDEIEREDIRLLWSEAVKKASETHSEIEPMEHSVTCKNGEVRDIEFRLASTGEFNFVILTDITKRRQAEARERHLTDVLRSIRNVNQLITQEKERDKLLTRACGILTESRGYCFAWICLIDSSDGIFSAGEHDIGAGLEIVCEQIRRGEWPACCDRALAHSDIVVVQDLTVNCVECAMSNICQERVRMVGALRHAGRNYGVLVVALPTTMADDPEEHSLFREVVGDIGFALHSIEMEAERERSELTLKAIFESASDGIVLADAMTRRFVIANNSMCKMVGFSADEISALSVDEIHPAKELPYVINEFEKQLRGEVILSKNIPLKRKDGSVILTDINSTRVTLNGRVHLLGMFRDITDRKQAEEEQERLRQHLAHAQKIESVGQLAGGIAHDYNNMLSVIIGYAELAMESISPGEQLYNDLNEILSAAQRSSKITRQLLTFARKQTIAPEVLDLNESCTEMLNVLKRLIGEDINLSWRPRQGGVWPVKMDPSQIDQLLTNLCVNARDAISGVGKITIETDNLSIDEIYCTAHFDFVPGDFVLLAVSDDGCGMDRATLDHIFEPFYTTKAVGKGTGMGLATVYGIVKQNNGFINVYSERGVGTAVKIFLPRYSGESEERGSDSGVANPQGNGETILLVEDEEAIMNMSRIMLEKLGYHVLAAATPGEAIVLAREHVRKIALLITDVVMPEMNGRDLANLLNTICPGLKTLFMSGYTANVIAHRGVLDDGINFIQKPFSQNRLATMVYKALGSS